MSGGAWDYLEHRLTDDAGRVGACMALMATIEHELDWGVSGDTCSKCARLRVCAALEQFFGDRARNASPAQAIARDRKQNMCEPCEARAEERK